MQTELPTLEYAEGESFRPHRAFVVMFAVLVTMTAGMLVLHAWAWLVLRRRHPDAAISILLLEALELIGVVELSYISLCLMRAFIQLRKEGIEFRPPIALRPIHWRKFRIDWQEIRAVTFVRRRKTLVAMKLEVNGRPKPVRVVIALYPKAAQRRIEAIVRQHVDAENVRERSIGTWTFRV